MPELDHITPPVAPLHPACPPGMAIKGGIARKIVKRLHGTPEPPSSFDIDALVLLPDAAFEQPSTTTQHAKTKPHKTKEGLQEGEENVEKQEELSPARMAHDAVTGIQIGALILEAQDVEVTPMVSE